MHGALGLVIDADLAIVKAKVDNGMVCKIEVVAPAGAMGGKSHLKLAASGELAKAAESAAAQKIINNGVNGLEIAQPAIAGVKTGHLMLSHFAGAKSGGIAAVGGADSEHISVFGQIPIRRIVINKVRLVYHKITAHISGENILIHGLGNKYLTGNNNFKLNFRCHIYRLLFLF